MSCQMLPSMIRHTLIWGPASCWTLHIRSNFCQNSSICEVSHKGKACLVDTRFRVRSIEHRQAQKRFCRHLLRLSASLPYLASCYSQQRNAWHLICPQTQISGCSLLVMQEGALWDRPENQVFNDAGCVALMPQLSPFQQTDEEQHQSGDLHALHQSNFMS